MPKVEERCMGACAEERGDFGRIEYQDADIPYNFGDWFGLETFQSYTASVTSNI